MNKEILKILEKNFSVSYSFDGKSLELESWTNGGVDMIFEIDIKKPLTSFEEYIYNFDIDEEIDMHRESEDYKNAFSIKESVKDFESYFNFLNDVLEELKEKIIARMNEGFTENGKKDFINNLLLQKSRKVMHKVVKDCFECFDINSEIIDAMLDTGRVSQTEYDSLLLGIIESVKEEVK